MPNWCNNNATIELPTSKEADAFEAVLINRENWFEYFKPMPAGIEDWYGWSIENWGTKWGPDSTSYERTGMSFSIQFDTAWSPPIGLYETINDTCSIDAGFSEVGMAFEGTYNNGEYQEWEMDMSWMEDEDQE